VAPRVSERDFPRLRAVARRAAFATDTSDITVD
jgi:hypothetical protein